MIQVLAITETECRLIDVNGLISIGGAAASGTRLSSLKNTDDYVVLSLIDGNLQALPLIGKARESMSLSTLARAEIQDLLLIPIQISKSTTAKDNDLETLAELAKFLGTERNSHETLQHVLDYLLNLLLLEKGLVVSKQNDGNYEVIATRNVNSGDPWLSESLLTETLRRKLPVSIQNIVGSAYESNKSLVASGFLSVFTWPLVAKGETIGAILVGSQRPHSGLSDRDHVITQIISNLSGVMLNTYLKEQGLKEQVRALQLLRQDNDTPFLTTDTKFKKTIEMASRVAATNLCVLIQGETGVGKEVMARWIHSRSDSAQGPFVAINCGAIPENLIESVLFGHKKGSFTGATSDHIGKFQQAHGGTLFLDEIGDLPLSMQVKLLRVLQEHSVEPVGANRAIPINTRVLAASHKSIHQMIKGGKFREDLYFRLAEVTIEIPPLRERPEDIGLITTDYLKTNSNKKLSSKAWNWLREQQWSGNVRELLSTIKRASVLSGSDEIQLEDFFLGQNTTVSSGNWLGGDSLDQAIEKFTAEKVIQSLRLSGGNRKAAAELLGITPRTLFRYLETMRGMTDLSSQLSDLSSGSRELEL